MHARHGRRAAMRCGASILWACLERQRPVERKLLRVTEFYAYLYRKAPRAANAREAPHAETPGVRRVRDHRASSAPSAHELVFQPKSRSARAEMRCCAVWCCDSTST